MSYLVYQIANGFYTPLWSLFIINPNYTYVPHLRLLTWSALVFASTYAIDVRTFMLAHNYKYQRLHYSTIYGDSNIVIRTDTIILYSSDYGLKRCLFNQPTNHLRPRVSSSKKTFKSVNYACLVNSSIEYGKE